jgi:hypothetical protein
VVAASLVPSADEATDPQLREESRTVHVAPESVEVISGREENEGPVTTNLVPSAELATLPQAVDVYPRAVNVVPAGRRAPRVVKLGASFTAARVIVTVAAAEESAPSDAVTVKVFAPFSFAAGT